MGPACPDAPICPEHRPILPDLAGYRRSAGSGPSAPKSGQQRALELSSITEGPIASRVRSQARDRVGGSGRVRGLARVSPRRTHRQPPRTPSGSSRAGTNLRQVGQDIASEHPPLEEPPEQLVSTFSLTFHFPLSTFHFLLFLKSRRDAERAHLAVQVAALDAEHVRGPRNIAVLGRKRAQDVLPLEVVARVVQRHRRLG